MKPICQAFLIGLLLAIPAASPALADVEDEQRIAECIDDNADEGQTADALMAYCTCANEKSSFVTFSITEWEKQHADEQEACSKEAGWISHPE